MGLVRYGIPAEYVLSMKQQLGIDCFVETGTSEGRTAAWAAQHFKQVVTIELSEALYHRASARLAGHSNVRQLLGSSPEALAEIARSLPPAIFWLDAHWGGGDEASREPQCPCWRRSPHSHLAGSKLSFWSTTQAFSSARRRHITTKRNGRAWARS